MKRTRAPTKEETSRKRRAVNSQYTPVRIPAKRISLYNRRTLTTELKTVDVIDFSGTTGGEGISRMYCILSGSFYLLNGVQQGAAFYNRNGHKINMKALKFLAYPGETANDHTSVPPQQIRLIFFYDRQSNGSAPNYSTLLSSFSNAGTQASVMMSQINPVNRERFKILRDVHFTMPSINTHVATNAQQVEANVQPIVQVYINLRNLPTTYQASTGGIGDITTGALYLFIVSNYASPNQPWDLYGCSRLTFYDP